MGNLSNDGIRLIKALELGWGFCDLVFNEDKSQRHHLMVMPPKQNGWIPYKVDASVSREDYLSKLLDEAQVPELKG